MTEDFLTASLHNENLQVDSSDPDPRPMIAILDARPGLEEAFREHITELVRQVRREPGCLTFTAYEARDTPGRFYLYEIYTDAAPSSPPSPHSAPADPATSSSSTRSPSPESLAISARAAVTSSARLYAQREVTGLLRQADDPNRPLPDVTCSHVY